MCETVSETYPSCIVDLWDVALSEHRRKQKTQTSIIQDRERVSAKGGWELGVIFKR